MHRKTLPPAGSIVNKENNSAKSDHKKKKDLSSKIISQLHVTWTQRKKFICMLAVILFIVAFLRRIIFRHSEPDRVYEFNKTIVELQSSFTNQTDRFWRILKNRGLAHLNNTSPPQPLVLLLAAPQLLTAQWTTWPGNLLQR